MGDDGQRFQLNRLVSYDEESLVAELRRVAEFHPDGPLTRELFDGDARASSDTMLRRWRSARALTSREAKEATWAPDTTSPPPAEGSSG